jgi:hypothetical protein
VRRIAASGVRVGHWAPSRSYPGLRPGTDIIAPSVGSYRRESLEERLGEGEEPETARLVVGQSWREAFGKMGEQGVGVISRGVQ